MRLARVLDPPHLPLAELCAARLDGDLVSLGRGWIPVDVMPAAAERAAAALSGLPARYVAERETALWVWGVLDREPAPPRLCLPRSRPRAGLRGPAVREVTIREDEMVALDGRLVTSPARTAIDLARHDEDWGETVQRAVGALLREAGVPVPDVVRDLKQTTRTPHRARALRRLAGVAIATGGAGPPTVAQPLLTR